MQIPSDSLFEQIGGPTAVEAAVHIFYAKVLADERVAFYFRWVDIPAQLDKQRMFLSYAFGAPLPYSGKGLRHAHAHLVKRGLNDDHFDVVTEHLLETLRELHVAEALIAEVAVIAERTRRDVLGGLPAGAGDPASQLQPPQL